MATPDEVRLIDEADLQELGLRQINHLDESSQTAVNAPPNLTIVLRATQQLQQNQTAVNAFTRAAQNWESVIMSPVTIYIDVDYGTTNFGQP